MGEPHGPPHDDPDHPGKPPGDPEHPEHPHGAPPGQTEEHPDKPDTPEEGEGEHPEHPIVLPEDDDPHVEHHEASARVEPTLGLDDFLAARPMKPAAAAMLKTWMRRQGKDSAGHYPLAQWEADYQEMLVAT
jgi:hypothetical protein